MIEETKYYDIFKGISQKDRFKEELQPDFVKIDGRSLSDLLQFIRNYAKEINFFDANKHDKQKEHLSNWGPFFNKDNLIILIAASNYNIHEIEENAHELMDKAFSTHDQRLKIVKFNSLVEIILSMGEMMNLLRKNLSRDAITSDLIFDIGNSINGKLKGNIASLYSYKNVLSWPEEKEDLFSQSQINWGWQQLDVHPSDLSINRSHQDELKRIFNSFFFSAHFIIEKASKILDVLLNDLKNNKPHIALYISFLKLFKYAQDIQNEIPKKHLNFYYREVLKQTENATIPDQAFIAINLSQDNRQYRLKKDTAFAGGAGLDNEPILYKATRTVSLSNTRIAKICGLYKSKDNRCTQKPYSSFITSMYKYEQGRPKEGYFKFDNRALFGEEQFAKSIDEKTMDEARLGFIISSPELNLKTGKRRVVLELEFAKTGFDKVCDIIARVSKKNDSTFDETVYLVFSTAFNMRYSSSKAIQTIDNYGFNIDFEEQKWIFNFELGINEAPIEPYLQAEEKRPLCEFPFVEICLKYECSLFMYSIIAELDLKNIGIITKVKQITDYVIHNNLGTVNSNQPFEVFGTIPVKNNYFLIGHPEIFAKNIKKLTFNLTWYSLPIAHGGMETYYKEYTVKGLEARTTDEVKSAAYSITPSYLIEGNWSKNLEDRETIPLFQQKKKQNIVLSNQLCTEIEFDVNLETLGYLPAQLDEQLIYSQQSSTGFLKFDLNCPEFAFGHSFYAPLLSEVVLKNATKKRKDPTYKQPKLPFSPVVDKLEISYSSAVKAISESPAKGQKAVVEFHHLTPFGYEKIELKSLNQFIPLMRTDSTEGSVLFGLDQYPRGGEISLLFTMNDETLSDQKLNHAIITWWYLKNNVWFKFENNSLLNDSTNGFVNSGIIELKIPKDVQQNNTIMDADLFWIKGTTNEGSAFLGKVTQILENGIHVIHEDTPDLSRESIVLPPYTISKSIESLNEIAEVVQPIRSFSGKTKESVDHFYQRVSERLRHKNRAITALDYEELVLEKFPEIYKAKCFMASHTLNPVYEREKTKVYPGSVIVVVAPDTDILKRTLSPRASAQTLDKIKDFLTRYTSPFVKITVRNPFYEQIRVICKVNFIPDESDSYYELQLQKDIIGYLNPWLTSLEIEEELGKNLFKSDVMAYIQNLNYVRFVTEFSMVKILENNDHHILFDTARVSGKGEEIKTTYPWSVLVSAIQHDITVINNPTYESPKSRGIINMSLGTDFILSN